MKEIKAQIIHGGAVSEKETRADRYGRRVSAQEWNEAFGTEIEPGDYAPHDWALFEALLGMRHRIEALEDLTEAQADRIAWLEF